MEKKKLKITIKDVTAVMFHEEFACNPGHVMVYRDEEKRVCVRPAYWFPENSRERLSKAGYIWEEGFKDQFGSEKWIITGINNN